MTTTETPAERLGRAVDEWRAADQAAAAAEAFVRDHLPEGVRCEVLVSAVWKIDTESGVFPDAITGDIAADLAQDFRAHAKLATARLRAKADRAREAFMEAAGRVVGGAR